MKQKKSNWNLVLRDLRFSLFALGILVILVIMSVTVLRTALLQNAWNTGMALSRNYAAEARNKLNVYETLLSFGSSTIEARMEAGDSEEELLEKSEAKRS